MSSTDLSELAYEVAGSIEHLLLREPRVHTVAELAQAVEPDLAAFNKRYRAMETALGAACQTAMIHGASKDEMRVISDLIEEGDKP